MLCDDARLDGSAAGARVTNSLHYCESRLDKVSLTPEKSSRLY
jgi:hypothetical protein